MQTERLGRGRADSLSIVARDDAVALVHIGTQHAARFCALLGHQLFARLGFTGGGAARDGQILRGRLGRRQRCRADLLHLGDGSGMVTGYDTGIDLDFATRCITLAIRPLRKLIGGRAGVLSTRRLMRLLVSAHLLVTLDKILNLLLLPLLLLLLFGILLLALTLFTSCLNKAIVWQCRRG